MVFEPNATQAKYLASTADICLLGGTVAGGKSWALLLDALGLNDPLGPRIANPKFHGLIYRMQYKHLIDLIMKSKQMYPYIDSGAKFNNSELFWTFSSGAKLRFLYFENIEQVEQIRGFEFDFAGCDELGLYPDKKVMDFVLSRLRSSNGYKPYYRATSNVSKYKWLRTFFNLDQFGSDNLQERKFTLSDGSEKIVKIQNIQSKLGDNKYIPKDYEANLNMLSEADREAMLYGNWLAYSVADGAVYAKEIAEMYRTNRYCNVPRQRGHDVFAAFDLGRSDTTAIIFFHIVGLEIQIIESYENRGEDITFYIDHIKKLGYEDARMILPHDSKMHRIEFKNSIFETMKAAFKNVEEPLKIMPIEEGIDAAKRKFPHIYIDKTKNERLIECITNYKRKHNVALDIYDSPIHDWSSNFADCLRYVCSFNPPEKFAFDFDKFQQQNVSTW